MELRQKQGRIPWVDLCKGIGILLVIAGHNMHCVPIYAMIYSFHMPLFFLLSAFTLKPCVDLRELARKTTHSFKRLILPAVGFFILAETVSRLMNGKSVFSVAYAKQLLRSLFFCTGTVGVFNEVIIEPVGVCWFLIVLFCARTLYLILARITKNRRVLLLCVCGALGVLGVIMKNIATPFTARIGDIVDERLIPKANAWPFALDVTLVVMPYFALGQWLRSKEGSVESSEERKPWKKILVFLGVWGLGFAAVWFIEAKNGYYFDLICRRYPLFPLCAAVAVFGSLAVIRLCALIPDGRISNGLRLIGNHTLELLCIHKLDFVWEFLWMWTKLDILAIVIRVSADLLVLILWLKLSSAVKGTRSSENG